MKEQVEELLSLLEAVHLDKRGRYFMTEKGEDGVRSVIYGRKEYLEFIVEVAINELNDMLEK